MIKPGIYLLKKQPFHPVLVDWQQGSLELRCNGWQGKDCFFMAGKQVISGEYQHFFFMAYPE
jgi:hypothetical protein